MTRRIQRQSEVFAYRIASPNRFGFGLRTAENIRLFPEMPNGVNLRLVPSLGMDEQMFTGQADQYAPTGEPGISHERHHVGDIPIDCLLHRDETGRVTGILNYFPKGTPYERPHSMTVLVHPAHQRKGIGKALVGEAMRRFKKLKLDDQEYSPEGFRMYRSIKRDQGVDIPDFAKKPKRKAAVDVNDAYDSGREGEHYRRYDPPGLRNAPDKATWYHRSPHELPPGTVLVPGEAGGMLPDDAPEYLSPRRKWVWMDQGGPTAYSSADNGGFLYEVTPSDGPYPWNGQGVEGWVAPRATVVRKVASGYSTVHEKVREQKGAPSGHTCVDCGKQADHWTYNHSSDSEKTKTNDSLPYSTNTKHYSPRCRSCHNKLDAKQKTAMPAQPPSEYATPKTAASVADQTIKRLEKEFNEWWAGTGRNPDDIDYVRNDPDTTNGPISDWPTIEEFLKDRYPAAHRGDDLYMGLEQAQPLLKETLKPSGGYYGPDNSWFDFPETLDHNGPDKYETGYEAVTKHGYDPAEIIAGMLYLHNQSHPYREQVLNSDRQRIMDIVKARRKMQKAYEQRQVVPKTASINDDLLTRLKDEFDNWHQEQNHTKGSIPDLMGVAHWPNVEGFLKEHYPAAHRGLEFGLEEAGALLDGKDSPHLDWHNKMYHQDTGAAPYETGPEAEAQYGYDPREIAAAMLLLHNMGGPFRQNQVKIDQQRLFDIAQKRFQMQRAYEQRQAARRRTAANRDPLRDADGRVLLHRAVGPGLDDGENIGQWWGSESDVRDGYGLKDGSTHVAAWFNPHDVESAEPVSEGWVVRPGAVGEVHYAQNRKNGRWVPHGTVGKGHRITAHRTAMPYYHSTDAELNPGDMLLPAAERGHKSRWTEDEYGPYPDYEPNKVYMLHADGDKDIPMNYYNWYGKNIYEVEPVGEVKRDPEFYRNLEDYAEELNRPEDHPEGRWSEDDVPGSSYYTVPRARVIRKLAPQESIRPDRLNRYAMPVPRNVPSNRDTWAKQYDKLNEKAKKNGLDVELLPNFSMNEADFAQQVRQHEWDDRGHPRRITYEGQGVPGGISHRHLEVGNAKIPIDYLLHHGDDGHINGILCYFPEGSPYEKPGSITVTVHPKHRNKGIGGKLAEEAERRFGVNMDEQQFTPLGYEMYRRLKHERGVEMPNIFNEKTGALSVEAPPTTSGMSREFLDQLRSEFDQWGNGNIGHWPDVENFLKERYPASHRDFQMGLEEARPLMRGEQNTLQQDYPDWWKDYNHKRDYDAEKPYETGPEAEARYGYDPRRIAAGMVLLHCLRNGVWSDRDMEIADDIDLLNDIFDKRVKQQRAYEENQKVSAYDWYTDFLRRVAMPSRVVNVGSDIGLHARPAAIIADAVVNSGKPVTLSIDGQPPADASSVMDILFLGAGHGTPVTVTADDPDLLDKISDLVAFNHDAMAHTARLLTPLDEYELDRIFRVSRLLRTGEIQISEPDIDMMGQMFNDYVTKHPPYNPATGQPHTPQTAIRDWLTGVVPFIQAVYPNLPYERYQYEPHTRGLDEFNDVPSVIAKLIALHTREKYGTETMYNRLRNNEIAQQAQTMSTDLNNQFSKGYRIDDHGKLVQMKPVIPPNLRSENKPTPWVKGVTFVPSDTMEMQ